MPAGSLCSLGAYVTCMYFILIIYLQIFKSLISLFNLPTHALTHALTARGSRQAGRDGRLRPADAQHQHREGGRGGAQDARCPNAARAAPGRVSGRAGEEAAGRHAPGAKVHAGVSTSYVVRWAYVNVKRGKGTVQHSIMGPFILIRSNGTYSSFIFLITHFFKLIFICTHKRATQEAGGDGGAAGGNATQDGRA